MAGRINMLCIDNSEFSEHAFDWYVEHYHLPDDTIALVHIFQMPTVSAAAFVGSNLPVDSHYQQELELCVAKSRDLQRKYEEKCKEQKLKYKYILGDPHNSTGHIICNIAKEHNANIIIMGQRGLGTFSRLFLGSVSDYVLHHSTCPVIVVPKREDKSPKE